MQVENNKEEIVEITEPASNLSDLIETTAEELEAFLIIKSILRQHVDVKRIIIRDAQSYCAILLDDNNRKPVCRLLFNGKKLLIGIPDTNKIFQKFEISELDDIYKFSNDLISVIENYIKLAA